VTGARWSRGGPSPSIRAAGEIIEGIDIVSADVFQAADRPDRLEATIAWRRAGRAALEEALRPGTPIRAALGGDILFEGEAARVARGLDPLRARGGGLLTLVGYAAYHRLRDVRDEERYWQAADGEIAERIASSLGLASVVEPGGRIHASITRRGDPLRFLRGLAGECGLDLAVTGGKLYFLTERPEAGDLVRIEDSRRIAWWEEAVGERGGGARALLAGDPRLRPLAPVEAAPAGETPRRWRIARALHRLGRGSYTTEVELLERRHA
jgi:hypothetical protein